MASQVIVRLRGGLGNQLFQYAKGLSLSYRHRAELTFDFRDLTRGYRDELGLNQSELSALGLHATKAPHLVTFLSRILELHGRYPRLSKLLKRLVSNRLLRFEMEDSFRFSGREEAKAKYLYVEGYWQSPQHFWDVEVALRSAVQAKQPEDESFLRLQEQIRDSLSMCVHVRRGDYLRSPHKEFHGVLAQEYYEKATRYLEGKYLIEKIFIFSDDPDWCSDNLQLARDQVIVSGRTGPSSAATELLLMSYASYFIISNSTFSWWAAWLSNSPADHVVAPLSWFVDQQIDTRDLFPPGWIRI